MRRVAELGSLGGITHLCHFAPILRLLQSCTRPLRSFLFRIQTMQPVSSAAFERLHALVVELMRSYKGSDRVSKSLLHAVYSMPRIISAELEHRPAERQMLEQMSQKLEMCFGLLLLGEVPEDRQPGVPRII